MKPDSQQLELVEACLRGDRRAQQTLYTRYARAMYNICLRMTGNQADAEDLLQTAFIDVFTKLHTFRGDATIGAWIKRITINTCINFLKKRRLEIQSWDETYETVPDEDTGAPMYENAYNVRLIRDAINALPDGYKVVFSLYLMEGYDHKEIGQILGITEATSKSQYSRAKQKLRKIIQEKQTV